MKTNITLAILFYCICLQAQNPVPPSITKKYGTLISNQVFNTTKGLTLKKHQYEKIAKGIDKSSSELHELYENPTDPEFTNKEENIKQKELDGFIEILGEDIYRGYIYKNLQDKKVKLPYDLNQFFKHQFVGLDSLSLNNLKTDFENIFLYNEARYKFSKQKLKQENDALTNALFTKLEPLKLENRLTKGISTKYAKFNFSQNQLLIINKTYKQALQQGKEHKEALSMAVESNMQQEDVFIIKAEEIQDKVLDEVNKYMADNELPVDLKDDLIAMFKTYQLSRDSVSDDKMTKQIHRDFVFQRRKFLFDNLTYSGLPAPLKEMNSKQGLIKYDNLLSLTDEQKNQWGEYCFTIYFNNNTFHHLSVLEHLDQIEKILTDSQYNILLKELVKPQVARKLKFVYAKFASQKIQLDKEDRKLLHQYYEAQRSANLRYRNNDKLYYEAQEMIKQNRSPKLMTLLRVAEGQTKNKAQNRGTYQW